MKTGGMKKQAEKEGKEKGANFTVKGEGTEKGISHCRDFHPAIPTIPPVLPVTQWFKWGAGLETQRVLSFVGTRVRNSDGALWLWLSMQGPISALFLSLSFSLSGHLSSRLLLFSLWVSIRHP